MKSIRFPVLFVALSMVGAGISAALAGGASPARAASSPVGVVSGAGLPERFRPAFCGDGSHELPVGYSNALLAEVKRREAGKGPMRVRATMIEMRVEYCGDAAAGRSS